VTQINSGSTDISKDDVVKTCCYHWEKLSWIDCTPQEWRWSYHNRDTM